MVKKRWKDSRFVKIFRWFWSLVLIVIVLDMAYLYSIWPDWEAYKTGKVTQSKFIQSYKTERQSQGWPKLKWEPVPFDQIPKNIRRAVVVAEDARFYSHVGIDGEAFKEVMKYNLAKKRFIFGGSTISQQTVKNMFLSPSRNPVRKWHELVITMAMERNLSKSRILEIYLNVAEFGRGVYGVNAAAKHYWGISASRLSDQQAIKLAATLPAPIYHNPSTETPFFDRRVSKIIKYF